MDQRDLNELLSAVATGTMSIDDASARLRMAPYTDLGYAAVDHQRGIRQGVSEVIYGAGKSAEQIAGIIASMLDMGQSRVLITRIDSEKALEVQQLLSDGLTIIQDEDEDALAEANAACISDGRHDEQAEPLADATASDSTDTQAVPDMPVFTYYDVPRLATIGEAPQPDGRGSVVVVCGGTSDLYVAEEAALTAEMLGNDVVRVYDVGVAGLHRLLAHTDQLVRARVVVAVAGMEGALPSVVGGLVSCPVIAVPTSVGYGASFSGLAALLGMLNSCASGVSVVNIDNGFGAGYQASLINH